MALFQALYWRMCQLPLFLDEAKERQLIKSKLVQVSIDVVMIIREWLKAIQNCQKNYADKQRRLLKFEVRDCVFLKVSPCKGLTQFKMKGKLKSRYIKLFEILQWAREAAYRSALLSKLSHIYNVFHVAMLRKYELDLFHVISFENIELEKDDTYIEKLVIITTCEERKLRTKVIPMVKVIWCQDRTEEQCGNRKERCRVATPISLIVSMICKIATYIPF